MKTLEIQTGTKKTNFINRLQEMEERILGNDLIEEMDTSVKGTLTIKKILDSKHPRNLGHHENTKTKNDGNRGSRRISIKRPRKYFHQNHGRKISYLNKMPIKVHDI